MTKCLVEFKESLEIKDSMECFNTPETFALVLIDGKPYGVKKSIVLGLQMNWNNVVGAYSEEAHEEHCKIVKNVLEKGAGELSYNIPEFFTYNEMNPK